jgi:hypothetical protein
MVESRSRFKANDVRLRVDKQKVKLFGFELVMHGSARQEFRSIDAYDAIEVRIMLGKGGFSGQHDFHVAFGKRDDLEALYYDISAMPSELHAPNCDIFKSAYEVDLSSDAQQLVDRMPDYLKSYIANQILLYARIDLSGFPHGFLMGAWTNVMCSPSGMLYVEGEPASDVQLIDLFDVELGHDRLIYKPSITKVEEAEATMRLPMLSEDDDG